jgi:2-dehydropantoate 2-reductase
MRVAIVGSGGVGGYFGGRLAAAGTDVAFLARGAHLEALRARGLQIRSPKGDVHLPKIRATDDPSAIGPVDVVFFTVKLYDTQGALAALPPLVGADTVVLTFQNGVESVDTLVRAVGRAHVGGGVSYVLAAIAEPGVICHTAFDHLIFGEVDGHHSPRLERLLEACHLAGFRATLSDNIAVDIWTKFVRLTGFSGMTAVTRSPIGVMVNDPDLLAMFEAACAEALAVAHAKGVPVSTDVVEGVARAYRALPPHAKASMLEDLERGRRLELPWLSGAIVRLGREVGVDTPIHRFIATVLKPHVNGTQCALREAFADKPQTSASASGSHSPSRAAGASAQHIRTQCDLE